MGTAIAPKVVFALKILDLQSKRRRRGGTGYHRNTHVAKLDPSEYLQEIYPNSVLFNNASDIVLQVERCFAWRRGQGPGPEMGRGDICVLIRRPYEGSLTIL